MESFVKQSLLYDFYGDLLTEHQRDVYGAYVLDNLSLAEISAEFGISRQGVHDIIKRSNTALEEYEEKLSLVEKFLNIKEMVGRIKNCSDLKEAQSIADDIINQL